MMAQKIGRPMVFRPSYDEFVNFNDYVKYMENCGAHENGIVKIIPPSEWKPRRKLFNINDVNITLQNPIKQRIWGMHGLYSLINVSQKAMTATEFYELASSREHQPPISSSYDEVENIFWKNINYNPPIYGADQSGSLIDNKKWNLNKLGTILDFVKQDYGVVIPGVNTSFVYFGMWKAMFAWHVEDCDLYSLNYLHYGAPKTWYAIPPKQGHRFERLAKSLFPEAAQYCDAFLRHKMYMISPNILKQYSINYVKTVQTSGEIVITFPYGYHAGFSHGFNCAEAINFASERWINYGKWAIPCSCSMDKVCIAMDTFIQRFQPDKYVLWKTGCEKGRHPEETKKQPIFLRTGQKRNLTHINIGGKIIKTNTRTPKFQPFVKLKRVDKC